MELTTVHECLKAAQMKPTVPANQTEGTITFRIHDTLKNRAVKICERNGTTISEYLRKCCEGLVVDYSPGIKKD